MNENSRPSNEGFIPDAIESELYMAGDFIAGFTKFATDLAGAASKFQIAFPVLALMFFNKYCMWVDANEDFTADEKMTRIKNATTYYQFFVGCWVVNNTSSTAGEGCGLLLMGLSPWAQEIVDAVGDIYEFNKGNNIWLGEQLRNLQHTAVYTAEHGPTKLWDWLWTPK